LGPRGISEQTGAVVDLLAGNREFVARGFVDREHAIAIRILSRNPHEDVAPGRGAIASRFARAGALRKALFGTTVPQASRVFCGENEGLPGVTVDRYCE
jgi:23S rRNA G2069 N7-methylase RlmK/C1962 C5-methylase RlmI